MAQKLNFGIIGAGGYVAPRHLRAIKQTGNVLQAAYDPHDGVGIIDDYFPEADFFVEFERFDRHISKLQKTSKMLHYLSVCSPNYLHDSHIRFGLRLGANVICEKPIVLKSSNAKALMDVEKETGKKVNTILQLRLHPSIIKLKEEVERSGPDVVYDFDLTYITARGNWYYASWKGNEEKSGGIATNIGIHFFDMLGFIFGEVKKNIVHLHTHDRAGGYLEFARARVRWFLSINADTLPEKAKKSGVRTYRSLKMQGEEIEFSDGFTDLHTRSYEQILLGKGYSIADSLPSIEIASEIREMNPIGLIGEYHPLCKEPLSIHPFKI